MTTRQIAPEETAAINRLALPAAQGNDIDIRIIIASPGGVRGEKDRLCSRQDLRPAMSRFPFRFIQLGERFRNPAGGRNSRQTTCRSEGGNNISIVTPACARTGGAVAQREGRAALHRNLLELPVGIESDPLAVWRKERKPGILGAGEQRYLVLVEQPNAEVPFAIGITRHED